MSQKKEQILEKATQLFATHGYIRTSTAMLAREAGVAEGTIFRHFKNKEEIFIELIERLHTKITTDVLKFLEVSKPENGSKKIQDIMRACYIFAQSNSTEFSLVFRDAPGHYGEPGAHAYNQNRMIFALLQKHFLEALQEGQNDGSIRADIPFKDMADLLTGTLVGMIRAVNLGFLTPSEQILPLMLALCQDSLTPSRQTTP